jgi:uncharacterized membrane protein YfcA
MIFVLLFLIGIVLGGIGGGGGLLVFPVLLFINHNTPQQAALLSMSMVGIAAGVSLLSQKNKQNLTIDREIIPFVMGSLLFIYISKYGLLLLKEKWINVYGSDDVLNHLLMFLFVPVIAYSAWNTWPRSRHVTLTKVWNVRSGFFFGGITGTLAGLFGAGGGFIIVPVLHQAAQFPLKKAIQTSLLIIAINGVVGGVIPSLVANGFGWIEWLGIISTSIGAVLGGFWSSQIKPERLKKSLSAFLMAVAIFIFVKEIYLMT